jgi:hypothetical protein
MIEPYGMEWYTVYVAGKLYECERNRSQVTGKQQEESTGIGTSLLWENTGI